MPAKNEVFILRLSALESEQLKYISSQGDISKAEVLRIGLQAILKNSQPSDNPKLQKFYKEVLSI